MELTLGPDSEFHNIVKTASGYAVREEQLPVLTAPEDCKFHFSFSVTMPSDGNVLHYVFFYHTVTFALTHVVYDEFWDELFSSQVGVVNDPTQPVTWQENWLQLVVNSPGFSAPLWGFVGSSLIVALPQDQDVPNPDLPPLPLKPGLVCSFADRTVWASGRTVIINNPGTEPRCINNGGFIDAGTKVLDIFQSGDSGDLMIITSEAVISVPPDGLAGFQFEGVIAKNTTYSALYARNVASSRGDVVGLTADGVVSLRTGIQTPLVRYKHPRKITEPVGPGDSGDFRQGNIRRVEFGFVIAIANKFCILDLDKGHIYWVYSEDPTDNFDLVGVCKNPDGRYVYFCRDSSFTFYGDGTDNATIAGVAMEFDVPGIASPTVREIWVTTDFGGDLVSSYVRDSLIQTTVPLIPTAPVIGTSVWGSSTLMIEREMRSRRHQRRVRVDQPYFEVGMFQPTNRLQSQVSIVLRGQGKTRSAR